MAFNQVLTITQTDCCDTIQICDETCQPSPCNAVACTDGYGVAGNPTKFEVVSTAFNITFPNGNLINGINLGYVPNNKAFGSATITAGTTGTVSISLTGYGLLGTATFNTNLSQTAYDLVSAINFNSANSGWSAIQDSTTQEKIWFYNTNGDGAGANGVPVFYGVTGDMAISGSATGDGGSDDPDCLSYTMEQLNSVLVLMGNQGLADTYGTGDWVDGVWVFEMVSYDAGGVEIGRVSETVLFDCIVVNCLKESLLVGEGCGCNDKYDERILRTRLKIEQARHQFNECLFDCAQETILKAGKMCKDVCIDC